MDKALGVFLDKAYFLAYHLLLETQTNAGKNTLSFGEVTLLDPCHSYLEDGEILTPQHK